MKHKHNKLFGIPNRNRHSSSNCLKRVTKQIVPLAIGLIALDTTLKIVKGN